MSEDRDRRVKDLFERALDAPPEERDGILGAEGVPPSIRAEVADLLRREAEIGGFLETPAVERLIPASAPPRLRAGDVVSGFTVVGVLGEGGGGVVYDAEQDEPRRRVALKLLPARAPGETGRRGFVREAADLARLHHPSIATVHAAGLRGADGATHAWIAMERIDGARGIVRHAREERLSRDARIRLLLPVCDALHHAHENGVVHRDVTPGNVLVAADGTPKLVDFGVAWSDGGGAAGAVGTVAYASPEQLSGGPAARTTDVYGAGALLYELLCGAVPHDVDALPLDAAVAAKRAAPPPPGARAPGIPADLDSIVLRAIAPDPSDRYPTAAALADDLRRFLDGEPVLSHRGGPAYHALKFVRRRKGLAFAVGVAAAALVGGASVSTWLAVENAAARGRAERQAYAAAVAGASAALRVYDVADARRQLDSAPARLRDWEWRHLSGRLDDSLSSIRLPGREIWYGAVSADGARLAVSGCEPGAEPGVQRTFAALVARDGSVLRERRFRADPAAQSITEVSPDGAALRAWEAENRADVPSVALSPDGRTALVGLPSGAVLAWGEHPRDDAEFQAHPHRVIAIRYSPDGRRFATAGREGTARLWDAATRAMLHSFEHGDRVISLAFDRAGTRLVTGCRDGTVRCIDAATGASVWTTAAHDASVEGVAVSADGAFLATASRDRTVRFWNFADGSPRATGHGHSSNVRDVAFDPESGAVVSASWDTTLRAWDAASGRGTATLVGHAAEVTSVAFAPDAPHLVSFSRDGTVRRWNHAPAGVAVHHELDDTPVALAFSPDGRTLAVARTDGRLEFLDASRSAPDAADAAPAAGGGIADIACLRDGALAAIRGIDTVEVWRGAAAGAAPEMLRSVRVGDALVDLAADAGGDTVCVLRRGPGGGCEVLRIDAASGREAGRLACPIPGMSLDVSPAGALLVGGADGSVALSNGSGAWTRAAVSEFPILGVAFDADGLRIAAASSDGTARILLAADLREAAALRGHADQVLAARFLPGGRRVVTVSRDRTVRLWDPSDGTCVLVLPDHGYPVTSLAVSADGSRIATGAGGDGNARGAVRIWTAP
ncbi:MAG: Serine/threonine-protein kinase PknD [Planctomycetes bacterium]|nr:Serine/threonine-protein kinase PknD [Planctomycetota bacterium]